MYTEGGYTFDFEQCWRRTCRESCEKWEAIQVLEPLLKSLVPDTARLSKLHAAERWASGIERRLKVASKPWQHAPQG